MNSIVLSLFPLVALIASGYLFKKYRFFSDEFWSGAEKLNYYILFPALLFTTLSTAKIDLQSLSTAIIAMLFVVLAVTAFLYILRMFWHIPPARFGVHVQSMVRFNTYIGLALVTSLFKTEGMAILAILLALCIPLVNVISVLALTSKEHMAIKPVLIALLKNPLIASCVVGAAVNALQIPIWEGFTQFIKLFSVSSLPLGLLCVGAALQFMQIKKKLKKRNPYAQDLKLPKYKQRIVKNKKVYARKGKKRLFRILHQRYSFQTIFQAHDTLQFFHHLKLFEERF